MAREAVRSDADPAYETGWTGFAEDRYAGVERAREETGEEGLAEHGTALQAVAPILSDRSAALTAFAAVRGLIRFHDHEGGIRDLVPSRLADHQERKIVRPRLELEECEFLRSEQFVHGLQQIACVFES